MDALSSQALVSGYRCAIVAAGMLRRFFPLNMTAAGTVPPAEVVVLGAGVAGLQAIATAKRLGAVVQGLRRARGRRRGDPLDGRAGDRPRARHARGRGRLRPGDDRGARRAADGAAGAVRRRGGRADHDRRGARAQGAAAGDQRDGRADEARLGRRRPGRRDRRQRRGRGRRRGGADRQRPGVGRAERAVADARPGLEALRPERRQHRHADDRLLDEGGAFAPDFEDEIVAGSCVTHDGAIRHEPTRAALEGAN